MALAKPDVVDDADWPRACPWMLADVLRREEAVTGQKVEERVGGELEMVDRA